MRRPIGTELALPWASLAWVVSESPNRETEPPVEGGFQLRRNAVRGFAFGALVAAVIFVFFVLVPTTSRPTALYVGLAVVLGVSIGLLTTIALVGWRVRRLTREL